MVNHNPICSCVPGFTGDPFSRCYKPIAEKPRDPVNPCIPSPCGPNADCRVIGESPACSCLANYIGAPPNCRPECTINPECPYNRACMNQRCIDPCPGSCGSNAKCAVINHTPSCSCDIGYTGDPFQGCTPVQGKLLSHSTLVTTLTEQFTNNYYNQMDSISFLLFSTLCPENNINLIERISQTKFAFNFIMNYY